MADVALTTATIEVLGRLIEALGSRAFGTVALEFLGTRGRFDSALVLCYHPRRRPIVLAEALSHPLRRNSTDAYVAGAYLLDPFFQRARQVVAPEVVRLGDIAPQDFLDSEYFLTYYKDSNVVDELNYLVPVGGDNVVAVCIERSRSEQAFSPSDQQCFRDWLAPLAALFRQHWKLGGSEAGLPDERDPHDREHDRLQALLFGFARERLTPREHEIAQLLLRGFTAPRIAADLHVSSETVRVHRRNIYEKLEISSLGELFTLAMLSLLPEHQPRH